MKKPICNLSSWTVIIDHETPSDNYFIYLKELLSYLKPKRLNLLSVVTEPDVPAELLAEFPTIDAPARKQLELEAKSIANTYFNSINDINFVQLKGDTLTEVLRFCRNSETDFLIFKNEDKKELASRLKKLVRKAPCTTMIIPSDTKLKLESILVPIDFSNHSDLAVDISLQMISSSPDLKLNLLHAHYDSSKYVNQVFETVYEVDKYLSKKVELDKTLRNHAQHKLEEYSWDKGINELCDLHLTEIQKGINTGEVLNKSITELKSDLLIIGAKGISQSKISLTGAVSEEVYTSSTQQPTIIVKEEKENISFLNALLNRK